MQLRPYQHQGIAECRAEYRAGKKRVAYIAPTGSGKGVLLSFVAKNAVEKGLRTIITAHRSEILDQLEETLATVNVPRGVIRSDRHEPAEKGATVASIQTLVRRLDRTPEPQLVIMDELHHSVSPTWMKIFAHWPHAHYLGLTATPERLDGRGLGDLWQSLVIGPTTAWLIENGFLARPICYAPAVGVDVSGLSIRMGDFAKNESEELMNKPSITGDAISHYRRYLDGKTAVAFCVSVDHAKAVSQSFRDAGIPSDTIDGNLGSEERKQRSADLASGRIKVLTSVDVISEGYDLPSCNGAILLRPTASLSMHLQQCGRCLRKKKDGSDAVILDHVGNCIRHGLPQEEREWSLEGNSAKRRKKESVIETRQCPKCYAIYQGTECPQCHHVRESKAREIEIKEGELRQIEAQEWAAKRQDNMRIGRAQTLEELRAIAKEKGYKPGWAFFRWKNSRNNPANKRVGLGVKEPMLT